MAPKGRTNQSWWSHCDGKCLTIVAFGISVLVVGAGGFVLGSVFARPIGTGGVERANAILEEAKRKVPQPTFPPKPSGHTEMETKTIMTPIGSGFLSGVSFPTAIAVPKI